MDGAILTAILIITVIAVIEGVSLFAESILKKRKESYYAIIPVMSNSNTLRERLCDVVEQTDAQIILLNCGTDPKYELICHNFCFNHKNAVFLKPSELENYFLESEINKK